MLRHPLSLAPMLDCTDRHFRHLVRLISRDILLYTEMLTTNEIFAPIGKLHLTVQPLEPPIALQLGGSDPVDLAHCTRLAADSGFNEVNLNVGCPSSRVQKGRIGACLMRQPELVAQCVAAMQASVKIPVTVKCRLGVDNDDSYEQLSHFIATVAAAGCNKFIVHARKAWLNGLSPKQNRTVPPLDYDRVYRLKKDFPLLEIILNGGVTTFDEVDQHLQLIDGVMIGRAFYNNPMLLSKVDQLYYGKGATSCADPHSIVAGFIEYIKQQLANGTRLSILTRHMLNLFQGQPGAKSWRRILSCQSKEEGVQSIYSALREVSA